MADSVASWTCGRCTYLNDEGGDKCTICQESRAFVAHPWRTGQHRPVATADDEDDTTGNTHNTFGLPVDASDSRIAAPSLEDCHDKSVRFSDLIPGARTKNEDHDDGRDNDIEDASPRYGNPRDSISALGHLSFAAWESDRASWTCKACTYHNEPRFLMCGACGLAEGSSAVEDELISLGLQRMSLNSAQDFLMSAVHKQLDVEAQDKLRHERAVEVLKERIKDEYAYDASRFFTDAQLTAMERAERMDEQKESSAMAKARKHIETLERIQRAEREEHEDMLFAIEQWRAALWEEPNEAQEKELEKQEELLNKLRKEWTERERELRQLRMRLEGNLASV